MTSRFLLSGSGGQGVISLAILLAQAAALYGGHNAVQTQAYGPEARGGATRFLSPFPFHPFPFRLSWTTP